MMQLDDLMQQPLLNPPEHFSQTVIQDINAIPDRQKPQDKANWLTWLALAGSGILGLSQLVGFAFSLWTVTTAH
jgi:hypothetical protein